MKYLLFTSSTCKACPAMKRNLQAAGIEYEERDVGDEVNRIEAGVYYVKALPTLVILGDSGMALNSYQGVRPVWELREIAGR